MQTILITGGAGFVGSNLALRLKAANTSRRILALDNLKRRGAELNLPRLRNGGVEFFHGDIRSLDDIESVGDAEVVIECSAEPSVLAGYNSSPQYVLHTNLSGTLNCLEYARTRGAGFLFLSTSRVYPMQPIRDLRYHTLETRFTLAPDQEIPGASEAGISELFPLQGARSLYGATKLASELILQEYVEMYGMPAVINRCGVLSGPWQMGKVDQGVIVLWLARHLYGGSLKYLGYGGTGLQIRDVLHVDDLYRLVEHQLAHLSTFRGEVFNVGGGLENSVSLQELTKCCQEITGKHLEISGEPADRAADIPCYITDNTKVNQATGWRPEIGLTQLLTEVRDWLLYEESTLKAILR